MSIKNPGYQLFVNYLEECYNDKRLGELYFPNSMMGPSRFETRGQDPFLVQLRDLYNNIANWNIKYKNVHSLGLTAIIAFGDAVHYPGYTEETVQRSKYEIFGARFGPIVSVIKRHDIKPKKAEFLVITRDDAIPMLYVSRRTSEMILLEKEYDKMKLYTRSIGQIIRGIENPGNKTQIETDEISIDAFKNGVPIFYDENLDFILDKTCIERENPRIVEWHPESPKLWGIIR